MKVKAIQITIYPTLFGKGNKKWIDFGRISQLGIKERINDCLNLSKMK